MDALRDMVEKSQKTTGEVTKRIRLAIDIFELKVRKAMIQLNNKQSVIQSLLMKSFLETEKRLKEFLISEIPRKFEELLSRLEKSVNEKIDGLNGKLVKLSERVELNNKQSDIQSLLEESFLEMEKRLTEFLSSEITQKFEERLSRLEKSFNEQIDRLNGKLVKLSESLEASGIIGGDQFYIRQFTEEGRHFQSNEDLASAAQSCGPGLTSALDEFDTLNKNKPKRRKKRNQAKS